MMQLYSLSLNILMYFRPNKYSKILFDQKKRAEIPLKTLTEVAHFQNNSIVA